MSATVTEVRLPFPELPDAARPWYPSLLMIDQKIVGKGIQVDLMRSMVQDWCGKRAEFVYTFYVSIDVPGENQIRYVGAGDNSLVGMVAVYAACDDKFFM